MPGLKHIEFLVSDLTTAMSFYTGLFEIIKWKKVSENGFKSGDTKIYFTENRGFMLQQSLGPRHVCFHADDRTTVDRVGTYLQGCAAQIIRGPLEVHGEKYSKGYYTVDFHDPDGYVLEVAHSSAST